MTNKDRVIELKAWDGSYWTLKSGQNLKPLFETVDLASRMASAISLMRDRLGKEKAEVWSGDELLLLEALQEYEDWEKFSY